MENKELNTQGNTSPVENKKVRCFEYGKEEELKEVKIILREIIEDLDIIAFSIDRNKLGNKEVRHRLWCHTISKLNKYKELLGE